MPSRKVGKIIIDKFLHRGTSTENMPSDQTTLQSDNAGDTRGTISAPALSSGLKPKNRAIKDNAQAKNIIGTFENAAREQNKKNARIMAKYNAEQPFTQSALESEGLGWKANFTTQPLPMLINKVSPRFVQAIEGAKYLTNSKLPDNQPGASAKTEAFRREITSTIRAWCGWRDFLSSLSQENALFGYAACAWLDEFHWKPKFFRQDEFYIPTGTKQNSKFAQITVLRETFLVHELFALIEDKEIAKARGWNIKNTVLRINQSTPEDRRSKETDPDRVYEDLIRESNVGMSFEAGALSVTVWHLLATEVTGKVSHYIYEFESFDELFTSEDQFESMEEACAFFSFEQGNGTMRGSKGIGRQIYAMAGVLDRARNEVVDRLNLSGKMIIQADDKALRRFKMSLVGNAILIGQGYQIVERKIDSGVEPFMELDQFLGNILDQIAGATTPKVFEGERVTKAQVDFFAQREEESKDNIISRFLNQFANMMTALQRRLCNPNTSEKDAKEMQERLLLVMSKEELKQLAGQPIAETVRDFTDMERQQIVLVAQQAAGNPLYNAKEMERRKVTALIDEEFADAVLLPDEDPTETAEQTRLQQLELMLIAGQGAKVPISPRDNDIVHLSVLMPAMEQTAATASKDPNADEILQAILAHAEQHYQQAVNKGADKNELAQIGDTLKKVRDAIPQLQALQQQQQQIATQGAPPPAAPTEPAPTQ